MGEITISLEEYKKMVELQVRANMFAEHVKACKYSIDKDDCARFLGFKLQEEEDGN